MKILFALLLIMILVAGWLAGHLILLPGQQCGIVERDVNWVSRNMSTSHESATNYLYDLGHFISLLSAFLSSFENKK